MKNYTFVIGSAYLTTYLTSSDKDAILTINAKIVTDDNAPAFFGTICNSNECNINSKELFEFCEFTDLLSTFYDDENILCAEKNAYIVLTPTFITNINNAFTELLAGYPEAQPNGDITIHENKHLATLMWFVYWIGEAELKDNPIITVLEDTAT